MIYITGDTHAGFSRIVNFCDKFKTKKEDILNLELNRLRNRK